MVDFLPALEALHADENPETGIEFGLAIPATAHGSMGLSGLSSDTLWDAMGTMVRYAPIRNALFSYQCFRRGEAAIIEFRPRMNLGKYEKFMGYTAVLAVYNIYKAISEDAASDATRLLFPWKRPSKASWPQTLSVSDTIFDFDMPFIGIQVPWETAMQPSPSADPDLCERLKMVGENDLTKSTGSTATRVRHLLRQKSTVWPSLQEVADKLAMSKRTIIRKLESENLSYQILLDEARTELACWFLSKSDMPLSEIAEQIGFSDQANFTRSFRRVQGCTPSQYKADCHRASEPS